MKHALLTLNTNEILIIIFKKNKRVYMCEGCARVLVLVLVRGVTP